MLTKESLKILTNKKIIILLLIPVLIVTTSIRLNKTQKNPKAIIIDQLSNEFPNPNFKKNATNILESKKYEVNYISEEIDVEFFQNSKWNEYQIIIIRSHSALRFNSNIIDFFTTEKYNENIYKRELERGELSYGEYYWNPGEYYFALTPRFISELDNKFQDSIVIAMGCNSLREGSEEMAKAFISKGANVYIGWSNVITVEDTDRETLNFLEHFFIKNNTIGESINSLKSYKYTGLDENKQIVNITSKYRYYPKNAENYPSDIF